MSAERLFPLAIFTLVAGTFCGCTREQYVTRSEFDRSMHNLGADIISGDPYTAPKNQEQRSQQVKALVEEAFAATTIDARTIAALGAADAATQTLQETLKAIRRAEEQILVNVSNAETTAFKAQKCVVMSGRVVQSIDLEQGSMESTNRPIDVGIQGEGFFPIKILQSLGGVGYTRNGNFFINNKGELVLAMGDGYQLVPPITLPFNATDVSIDLDGTVTYALPGSTTKATAGCIHLATFPNPRALKLLGGSIYLATDNSGEATSIRPGEEGAGQLLNNFLEASNVDLFRERLRLRWLREWRESIEQAIEDRAPRNRTNSLTSAR